MMLYEITDISEHQPVGFGIGRDGTIVRGCNGRREDFLVDAHVREARRQGCPRISLYAYCEPGVTEPEFVADMLCRVARRVGIPLGTTLAADIEQGAGDLRWYLDRFAARVREWGYACRTYSGACFGRAHNVFTGEDWVAAYGANDGGIYPVRCGSTDVPWWIHQFTSVNGLDRNRAEDWIADAWFSGAAPPPRRRWHEEEQLV